MQTHHAEVLIMSQVPQDCLMPRFLYLFYIHHLSKDVGNGYKQR